VNGGRGPLRGRLRHSTLGGPREPGGRHDPGHGHRSWAGSDNVEAGREFFIDRILPELKPALLSGLSEIEEVVDQAFRRIEKNIKRL
jgi:hypothetical protein